TVRACQCSFCRKHGARTAVDPQGQVRIRVEDEGLLGRYRWNLRTAEFLVCARCGCYVGAVTSPDRALATVNLNVLDEAARFSQPPQPVSYDGEPSEQRRRRREAGWTPALWPR